MEFQLTSDLHIQYNNSLNGVFYNNNTNILVLCGDVCESFYMNHFVDVYKRINDTWEYVLYVPGNHEHYGRTLYDTGYYIQDFLDRNKLNNIILMNNRTFDYEDTTFIGTTLWSDMLKRNPNIMNICEQHMLDYSYIMKNDVTFILSKDTCDIFDTNIQFIKNNIKNKKKVVLLTHHTPSFRSIDMKYLTSKFNGGYASDLEYIIKSNKNLKIWCHGHTHCNFDYKIEQCKVLCHPRGYIGENIYVPNRYIPKTIIV